MSPVSPELLPQLTAWLAQFNAVDIVLFVFLALYALDGMRRGFIAGALGLTAIALTLVVASIGAPIAGQMIGRALRMPELLANTLGFFVLLIVAQIITALAVKIILGALTPVRLVLAPLMVFDHVLGIIPGVLQAAIIATLVLMPLQLFPAVPQISRALEGSVLAQEIPQRIAQLTPFLDVALAQSGLRPGLAQTT